MISDQSKGNVRTKSQKLQMHYIKRVDRESPKGFAIPELPIVQPAMIKLWILLFPEYWNIRAGQPLLS